MKQISIQGDKIQSRSKTNGIWSDWSDISSGGGTVIDDTTTSLEKTWSSSKMQDDFMLKSEYDVTGNGFVNGSESIMHTVYAQEEIIKGDPLYVSVTGNPTMVKRAKSSDSSTMPAIGVAHENISAGTTGIMIVNGSLNSFDTSSFTPNQKVYVGVNGGITGTKPSSNSQHIGIIARVGGSDGVIIINPDYVSDVDQSIALKDTVAIACSDETSDLTASSSIPKIHYVFRDSFTRTLNSIVADLNTAPTGSTLTIDIKKNGTSIFSTLLTIDASETSNVTAAIPYVLASTVTFVAGDYIDVYVTITGSTVAGKGLKINLLTTKSV